MSINEFTIRRLAAMMQKNDQRGISQLLGLVFEDTYMTSSDEEMLDVLDDVSRQVQAFVSRDCPVVQRTR